MSTTERKELLAFRLRRSDAAAVVLLPAFLGRVHWFLTEFEPTTNIPAVLDSIWRDFGTGNGDWLLLAFVVEGEGVKGHLLAGTVQYYTAPIALVYQWEHDKDVGYAWPAALAADQILIDWAEARGCGQIVCYPNTKSRARLFRRAGYVQHEGRMTKGLIRGTNG
ncbi:MAG: hypothetical protein K8R59_17390 [Thermoanaerobaculales bacterium]|nr:hypothetical protein [Thermoanaerobaculales bacterium]